MNSLAKEAHKYWRRAQAECGKWSVLAYLEAMDVLLRSAYQQETGCYEEIEDDHMRAIRQRYCICPAACDEVFERGEAAERALFRRWQQEDRTYRRKKAKVKREIQRKKAAVGKRLKDWFVGRSECVESVVLASGMQRESPELMESVVVSS